MNKITLNPSILCIFTTSIRGGVQTRKFDAETRISAANPCRQEEEYRVVRVVEDVEERARAQALVSRCRRRVNAITVDTVLGPLAKPEDERALDAAFRECEEDVAAFNASAQTCTVTAVGVKVEVAASNEQAALAIANQVRALVGDVQAAIAAADVPKIRQLAATAKGLDSILPGEDGSVLAEAIKAARAVANKIVREVEKKGRPLADVLAEVDTTPVEACAAHFLDVAPAVAPVEVAGDDAAAEVAGALDLDEEPADPRGEVPLGTPDGIPLDEEPAEVAEEPAQAVPVAPVADAADTGLVLDLDRAPALDAPAADEEAPPAALAADAEEAPALVL